MFGIELPVLIILIIALGLVCIFEFINGFNDTANAVAPVIYTKALKPKYAVLLAALCNFLGVLLGGVAVAMAIIHLLPLDLIMSQPTIFGMCLVASLLLSAIIWNLTTWYFAVPSSSSHALIGSILGASIAMMFLPTETTIEVVPNWHKAFEMFQSLLFSPLIGFSLGVLLMYGSYKFIQSKKYFKAPKKHKTPKTGLRSVLIAASAWVSFAHGSNDGQKGVGIAMLIVIALLPTHFAINPNTDSESLQKDMTYIESTLHAQKVLLEPSVGTELLDSTLGNIDNFQKIAETNDTLAQRQIISVIQKQLKELTQKNNTFIDQAHADSNSQASLQDAEFHASVSRVSQSIDYAPLWIILMISISLGIGTMVGRKRIVVTIGEKIGDTKMTYAQATNAALITATTITFASRIGLPVSTTHIMSSSVAGTMMGGKKGGVNKETIHHILLAWVLTLPITIVISGILFSVLFWLLVK